MNDLGEVQKRTLARDYFNNGKALYDRGKYNEAIGKFTKAIEKNPSLGEAFFGRGLAYCKSDIKAGGSDQIIVDIWKESIKIEGKARIRWWQEYAHSKGYYLESMIDGEFGPLTEQALCDCASDPECLPDTFPEL